MKASVDQPINDLNTTPLNDVMLILLVMFIVTIPVRTHAVKLDLPSGRPPLVVDLRPVNLLEVRRDGALSWNGRPVAPAALPSALQALEQALPSPELHLRPDPLARYDDVDRVLATVKRAQVTRFGFVGNDAYSAGIV